jgi:predicted Zn finger-like uncharacterized protein
MKIICTHCKATYSIPESRIPDRKASFQCKQCGQRIIVRPMTAVKRNPTPQPDPWTRRPEATPAVPAASAPPAPPAAPAAPALGNAIAAEFPGITAFAPEKYDLDHMLPANKKGKFKTRLNKLKLKLLGAVQKTVDRLLDRDERVMHIAAATAYYPAEVIFGNGWMTLLYNRYILVATNKRLVAVNTNYKMNRPTHYLFQFPYNEIKKISRGLFGTSLTLTRKKGKRRTFTAVSRALSAELKAFIDSRIDPVAELEADAQSRDNLCPACFAPLAGQLSSCPKCHAVFKSPGKAALRSLLLPGWGDIYLGHRFLGFMELLGSLLIWVFCIILLLSSDPSALSMGLAILLVYNGMDCLLSLHMARKGYSLEKKTRPRTAPADQLSTSEA